MIVETIFGVIYGTTSYKIVKKLKPNAFTSTEPKRLITDVALPAAGAVTVAPIVILGVALKQLAGVGIACAAAGRR